ncbi:MAG: hypothetical protein AB9869_34310 [Verrucomicrobiia bacterium]
MTLPRKPSGPWAHRLLIYCFTGLFAILNYWLLGFVINDIGTWPGPNYQEIERAILDQSLVSELESLNQQTEEINRQIANWRQRQQVLRDSTSNSEKTMNQLLELQRLTLQKGVTPSPDEVQALSASQKLFLANQTKYQEANDQIATLTERLTELQARQREAQASIDAERVGVQREYSRQASRHQWKLAALKLGVLVPLLGLAVWLFVKRRGTLYAPLVYGFGLALIVRVALVMHQHFPRRYFKYILVVVALVLVARVLVWLLRSMAYPKLDWLLKQVPRSVRTFPLPDLRLPHPPWSAEVPLLDPEKYQQAARTTSALERG